MKKILTLITVISMLAIGVLPAFALSATPDSGELDDYEHDIWFPTDAEGVRDYWLDWVNKCKADDENIIDNFVFIVLIDEQIDKAKDFTPESFPGMDVKEIFWNKYITKENTGGFPWAPIGSRATIVDLILNRHDKNNVIRVIEELNRRDDIYLALCDFEWHADGATQDSPATPSIPYTGGGATGHSVGSSGDNAGGFIATGDNGALFAVCAATITAALGALLIFRKKKQ